MGSRIIKGDFPFGIEVGNNEIELDVKYEATIVVDNSYGSDADGNRGTREVYLDELILNILWGEKDITDFVETFLPDEFKKIEILGEENAWENDDDEY